MVDFSSGVERALSDPYNTANQTTIVEAFTHSETDAITTGRSMADHGMADDYMSVLFDPKACAADQANVFALMANQFRKDPELLGVYAMQLDVMKGLNPQQRSALRQAVYNLGDPKLVANVEVERMNARINAADQTTLDAIAATIDKNSKPAKGAKPGEPTGLATMFSDFAGADISRLESLAENYMKLPVAQRVQASKAVAESQLSPEEKTAFLEKLDKLVHQQASRKEREEFEDGFALEPFKLTLSTKGFLNTKGETLDTIFNAQKQIAKGDFGTLTLIGNIRHEQRWDDPQPPKPAMAAMPAAGAMAAAMPGAAMPAAAMPAEAPGLLPSVITRRQDYMVGLEYVPPGLPSYLKASVSGAGTLQVWDNDNGEEKDKRAMAMFSGAARGSLSTASGFGPDLSYSFLYFNRLNSEDENVITDLKFGLHQDIGDPKATSVRIDAAAGMSNQWNETTPATPNTTRFYTTAGVTGTAAWGKGNAVFARAEASYGAGPMTDSNSALTFLMNQGKQLALQLGVKY